MKKFLISLACILALGSALFAESITVFETGKKKGSVPSFIKQENVFVDAKAMAKRLGGESSFSSQSKTMRIKIKSFVATFTAGKRETVVNGEHEMLPMAADQVSSKIYVPVEFFLNKKLSAALNMSPSFSDGKFSLEKFYNIEYSGADAAPGVTTLAFATNEDIKYKTVQKNKGVVEIELESSIVKRSGKFSVKESGSLISNFTVKNCGKNECIRVLLKTKAKSWTFVEEGNNLVFRAFDKETPAVVKPVSTPRKTDSGTPSPRSALQDPESSADEDDDGEEISAADFFAGGPVIAPARTPIIAAAPSASASGKGKKMRIVVDPGHGGKDPGAVRRYSIHEKQINLAIADELRDLLKKAGYEVKMTRETDKFIALHERSKFSNDYKADLFVSIHTNASKNSSSQGFEVYFRSEKASDAAAAEVAALENEALQYEETHFNFADMLLRSLAVNEYINESSKLASYVRNNVRATKGIGINVNTNTSVRQANFYVLKGVDAPAILVEVGYISNVNDRKQLNIKNTRNKLAEGIYKGIVAYAKAEQ